MSDMQDDPLLGLLTDIAEGVAKLATRIDTMETTNAEHQVQMNEALATIAEIATRTYYVSKPPNALPEEVINASVMDAMIERWPRDAVIDMSDNDREILSKLDGQTDKAIDELITYAQNNLNRSNAVRLRLAEILALASREKARRSKVLAQEPERDTPGRMR